MLDDLLELVLDVGGELLFSRKKGEQGKPEGQPSVPDGGRRQQKSAFQPGKDCDTDTLLYFCLPDGPTCHTGRDSCFFQEIML